MVDELRAAYEVHAQDGQRQEVHGSFQGEDDESCRRRLRIERMKVHRVSTSVIFTVRVNFSFEGRPAVGDGDRLRRTQARPRASPAGLTDLNGVAQQRTGHGR